jgi:hypothetical protein
MPHPHTALLISVDARSPAGKRHLMAKGRSSDFILIDDSVFPDIFNPSPHQD